LISCAFIWWIRALIIQSQIIEFPCVPICHHLSTISSFFLFYFCVSCHCTNGNIPCQGKFWFHHYNGRVIRSCANHKKWLFAIFGFVASSIHISMDVVYDSKKVTKEIYQVLIFGSNGFHCLVITSRYKIVRKKLFKHFQDTIVTLGTIAYVANDTFHDVHVK
jgi:hypothetical protein